MQSRTLQSREFSLSPSTMIDVEDFKFVGISQIEQIVVGRYVGSDWIHEGLVELDQGLDDVRLFGQSDVQSAVECLDMLARLVFA